MASTSHIFYRKNVSLDFTSFVVCLKRVSSKSAEDIVAGLKCFVPGEIKALLTNQQINVLICLLVKAACIDNASTRIL